MCDMQAVLRPCAMALAIVFALGLSGCGGGGANVRSSSGAGGSYVTVDGSATTTWFNNTSGAGGLTKSGTGTLILTGQNTYTGGTTINGGTLQLGRGGASGTIIGDVLNNGSLVFNLSGNNAFEGVVSGSGSLTQAGTGKVTLTGDNTYTGGTTISQGILQIGASGSDTGSIVGNVTNNGSLILYTDDEMRLAGVVSGSGTLVKDGVGTTVLTGASRYTGGTTISGGTLQIGDGGNTGSITGDVVLFNAYVAGTLAFDHSDDQTFKGNISGTGALVKSGTGTLTLSGANTFSGPTTVNAGTLRIVADGDLGVGIVTVGSAAQAATLEVAKGATISSGRVQLEEGSEFDNAGTFAPSFVGTTAVWGSESATVSNHDGGLIEGDSSQQGQKTPAIRLGLNSTLTNGANSTVRGQTGVESQGVVNNLGGRIIGIFGDGIEGAAVVNNRDGGRVVAGTEGNVFSIVSIGVKTRVTNAIVNNVGGSTINGVYVGVMLSSGGTVTNASGSIISGRKGVSIAGVPSAGGTNNTAGIVNNTGGSTITGKFGGVILSSGGTVTNGPGSTIEVTASASGDCSVTLACSIYVPVYHAYGSDGSEGRLSLTNAGSIIGNVQMGPTAINDTTLLAGGSIQGDLLMGANAQSTLTLGGDTATPQLYSDAVTGTTSFAGTLIKDGKGIWLIDSNDLSGVTDTQINGGVLRATSVLAGKVDVAAVGTLDGVPGIAGDLSSAGTVAVRDGDSTVSGNYTQAATGTLAVSLGSKLDVAGATTLGGGTLEITGADSGYVSNTHTEVLTAGAGLSGTFDQLVKGTGVVFTATTINYDANSAWLDTTGLDVTVAAKGPGVSYTPASMGSAVRVQDAFEQLDENIARGSLGSVSNSFVQAAGAFQQSPNLQAAQASLESLSGELHAASAGMVLQAIDVTGRALSDRMTGLSESVGVPRYMWMRQLKQGGDMGRNGFSDVDYQLNGWLVGSDVRLGRNAIAGFAFSQGSGFGQLRGHFDRTRGRNTAGMVYAGWADHHRYANGRVGMGHYRQSIHRMLLLGTSYQGVATDYVGRYNVAYGESGLRFDLDSVQLSPFVDLEYDRVARNGFTEQGAGGFGLKADGQTLSRWQGGIGLKLARLWHFSGGHSFGLNARAQWRQTLSDSGGAFDASLVGLDAWQPLTGVGLSRRSAVFGLDLDAKPSVNTRVTLGYEYLNGDRGQAGAASAHFSLAF